jgi:hypothetical protein
MSDAPNDPYKEPFFQTIVLTTAPLDAVASRLMVDAAAQSLERRDAPSKAVMMTPLRARVSLPDWKPETLRAFLNAATETEPGEVPPLEAVTGGLDAEKQELVLKMKELVAEGLQHMQTANDVLQLENALGKARNYLQRALTCWTLAEMYNLRLYSDQLQAAQAKAKEQSGE